MTAADLSRLLTRHRARLVGYFERKGWAIRQHESPEDLAQGVHLHALANQHHFTYEGEAYSDNDLLSVQEGEGDFRRQTLFVDITSGVALYAVSYPNWDGTHLIHDPTFSIYMTLPSETPWGWILLLVTVGAIAACAIVVYFKKQGRF